MIFDEKYEQLRQEMDPDMNAVDKLIHMNHELFTMIDNTVSVELLARLFSTQLITKGERYLLDLDRTYYRVVRQIILEGLERGEIRSDTTVSELSKLYALCERALMYDWCICGGNYSLKSYSAEVLPRMLSTYRA